MTSSSRHNEVAEAVFLDKNKVPGGNSEETVAEVESLQEPVENWDVVNIKEENVSEIASLKEAMESKLDTLNQDNIVAIEALKKSVEENVTAIASLKESVDAKINTLNQNVVNLIRSKIISVGQSRIVARMSLSTTTPIMVIPRRKVVASLSAGFYSRFERGRVCFSQPKSA
jgi:hypothetical protein